jgi:transketolase
MENFQSFLNKSSRDAYGIAFYNQAAADERIVAVTADVPDSVRFSKFKQQWPDRFFNFGIAEQNMMGAAAGLAREGKIPFVSVYAIFAALRALEQLRTDIAYPGLPVRICTTHSGISLGQAGPSHHSVEDIAIMRSIFNMTVIAPADGLATAMALEAIKDHPGPVYMRLSRAVEPTAYSTPAQYAIGKANLLREGQDITIIAYGASVGNALLAADLLEQEGIRAGVLDMAFIKPIDRAAVEKAASQSGRILTVEEHQIFNGLGSAVAEVIAESNQAVIFRRLALPDQYTLAGSYPDLQKYYRLDPQGIADNAKEML